MQDDLIESYEDVGGTHAPSMDLLGLLVAVLRRWKLIAAITLCALVATYGFLKLVPSLYKSAVEILVYDPQQQIDTAVQKPISPFVDAVGFEAMNTEIEILRSKSVALRVAKELGLDKDPEFLPRDRLAVLAKWLKFLGLSRANGHDQAIGGIDGENTEKLDQAADALLERLQVWQESYIIFVSATSQDPIKAQRLASTIAKDYLASQREARQEALERVATWLKGRIDNLRARVLETEASIEKLKADSDIGDAEFNNAREQQIRDLNTALMTARERVDEKHARLEQARRVIDTNGDIQSIPELTASTTLTELRQRQTELTSLALDLQKRLGEHHARVIAVRAELAAVTQQINAEAEHIFGNMKNAYDIAVQQEQSLKANLQSLSAHVNSQTYTKLEQLRHAADVDRKLYQSYLSEYNDVSERRTLQDASSRIISPATLPRSPSSPRYKLFYAGGGMLGLGSGFLLAFLLEYLQSGIKTGAEIEESLGRPVLGIIPLMRERWVRTTTHDRLLHSMVDEPLSHLSEAVHAIRISLELSAANPKVILISSALPAEGKSTAAMLLATSSASSGKRTILLDCDLRQQSTSEAFRNKHHPGLSELLRGTAKLADVITKDPLTKAYVIPAGSMIPNPADWLMSQRMKDLISALRQQFDYIILDTSPLLPVVDALVLATLADKILVIVEWSQTPRASISEAFKILRPQAHRVAGIVLNKVDLSRLPGYSYRGGYYYRSTGGTSIALASGRPGRSFATIQADTEYQG